MLNMTNITPFLLQLARAKFAL